MFSIVIMHCAISVSDIGCNLPPSVSDAQINGGWATLGQNFGRKG